MTGNVPYQWVLRRIALARFLDADTIFYPPAAPPKLVDLAPNVAQIVTGANNLIVNMKDGLAIFDAPVGEIQSKYVIDAAKKKFPGKPIKYLVLTHHHMDHTGGMRTYAAEGAEIIVPAPDKAYFEQDLKGTHTVLSDELQQHPKTVQVTEVADQMTLKDDTVEIKLYRIDNPHVDGMLMPHVVGPNIVWLTDLFNPGTPASRNENSGTASEGTDKDTAREQMRSQVAAVLDDRKVGDVLYFLGQFLGLPCEESPLTRALGDDAREAEGIIRRAVFKAFLEADAASSPVCLIFENLHQAHDDSLALLRYLLEYLAGSLLVVCSARPELLARQEDFARSGDARHKLLELGPLGEADASALLRHLLAPCEGGPPAQLVGSACVFASGNPLLLEQMVSIYHDKGVVKEVTGTGARPRGT